jgi:hypothetical protein
MLEDRDDVQYGSGSSCDDHSLAIEEDAIAAATGRKRHETCVQVLRERANFLLETGR